MKKLLLGILGLVVGLYVAVIAYVKVNERTLVFHANLAKGPLKEPTGRFQPPHTKVTFASADGTPLVGWVVPAAPKDSNGTWVLVHHGNSHNLSQLEEPEFYEYLRGLGVNILAFDYRGFGESGGEPDEEGAYADARAAYDLLVQKFQANPERIIIYGHSLGTGIAVQLASTVKAGALILQAPYTSIPDLGARRYPFLPVQAMAKYRFPSLERMPSVKMPLLVMHSPSDSTIPMSMGAALTSAASSTVKQCVSIKGGHNIAFKVDSATFFSEFEGIVRRVSSAPPPSPTDVAATKPVIDAPKGSCG
ncbi:MAG: alpha/beta hydrolase [Gemmatimonadetes bacterium]|nr:alpha/beta hydrolase [Gemmatimonadota bacterium]